MSANFPPVGCGTPTEIVFRGIADLRGQEHPKSASAQGADGDVHLCSLMGSPVPKGLSNSSDNVIVERTPTLVRKVTVLKRLPERQPIPSRERSVVVKSTKLLPGSYSGSHLADSSGNTAGSKKPSKELSLKTDKENLPKKKEEDPMIKSEEQAEDDIFKLISKDYTDSDDGEEKNLSEQSGSRAKKEYVKLQIQKRKQQRIQDLIKKREQEETKLKNLKELKDKQLKLVQNNVRRARQRQQQQQQQQQDQETDEVTGSQGQYQQWKNEEIVSKIKENAEVNITFKNMVATLQKELKGFGHQKKKEDGEIPRHITNVTMRNKDTMVSSEQLVPNFGGLFGKLDQLKKLGPQNESDVDIPLNDGNTEAPSNRFGLEPMVPSLSKEDADCLSYSSLQTYNLKKQPSYGVKMGVTKTLQEYFGTSKRKHLAALKIQAAFRGYQVRKMMKKDNKFPMKNKNYANTETVDHLRIKCLPTTSAEPEIGSASLIHEKFRSRDPQQLDILVKKEVTKILKDMNLKVSIDSNSKLESPVSLQPKIPVAAKEHVKPKGNDIKKTDIIVRKEVTKTLKEFMETRKKQELAATKIQAAFRGYRARKLHNMETKRADKYTFFKGITREAKDTVSPNRQSISARSGKSRAGDGYLKTAEFSSVLSSRTGADPLSAWLKPMYIEPCPYNVMTAIQNTMLSRSGPRQPYWVQANHEHMNEQSKAAQTSVRCESGQALPVIDASKEKARKQSAVHQFIHRDYETNIATDNESMQCEDGLSVISSALEAEHNSSSDESRVRWKKRLSVTSPQEVLPSRVKPVHWSKSDSEIVIRPSFSAKLQKNFEKINMERNVRSLSSAGRPAVMPKKVKRRHYGLVPPDVELRRKKERILVVPVNSSCHAESSGSDTWDSHSHSLQQQHVDQPFHSAGTVHKAHKKGLTSRETGEFRHTYKKQDGGLHHIRQSGHKQKENIKGFQDEVRSDVKDILEEKMNTQTGDSSRPPASGGRSIADILKAGRMLHPNALHLRFQAEMNRLDSVEESRRHLAEIEAILAQSMQAKKESERMQQAAWEAAHEDKQVQAEPISQTSRSHVQTQMPNRAHHLVQLMPCDQMKFPQSKAVEPFLEADFEQDKQEQVASSTHMQTPGSSEPKPLSQPHLLMPVVSNSHPEFRPIHSALSLQIGTVPETLVLQTQVKRDSLQSLVPTHRHVSEISDIQNHASLQSLVPTHRHVSEISDFQNHANQVSMAGTSGAILESVPSRLSVTQLLQEAESTRRMVTLDSNVLHEAMSRRREHLMSELSVKYEQWDIKHKEFMKRIEKEDNEQLNRILLRKFTVTSNQPFLDVPASQFHQPTKQTEDVIRSADSKQLTSCTPVAVEQQEKSDAEPLLQTQKKFENVNYKRGSDIVAEALSNIGKEVTDLERTVADNLVDSTPEQSLRTISEGISEKDDSIARARNKELQDLNVSQTSSFSDAFINEVDNVEKVSRIRESLHKIDKLIHEEKETAQKHVDLLNEKFRLVKERTRADLKLLLVEIRELKEKGEEHLVPGLKKKQFALLHNLEQARQDSKREYDKLLKATARRKLALRQQKAIIKSYLKSVQLRGRSFEEGHRSTSELNGDIHKRSSVSGAEEEPFPSTKEDILGPVPKSESLEFSVTIPPHIAAADDQVFSSNEVNTTVADISLKQIQSNSEEKFNAFEESTDSFPQTEAGTELSDLERRVRGLREQLHKKKSEAEKLRQEQQRKKKEHLRIKEQSLLKQIHAYDAYIDEIKKELEDKMDYSTDTSLPPGKLWIRDNSEYDADSASVSTAQSSGNKLFKQKQDKHEGKKSRTNNCGLVSGSCSQPVVTSVLKEIKAHEFQISADDTNANTQLREDLQALTNENHMLDNSSLETVLHSFVSSSMKEDDLKDEKGSKELLEELEQVSEMVSVIEEEVQEEEEEERDSELNSTVCDHNSENSVQESLFGKPESESVIQELTVSKHCTSVQGTESAEEVESVLEEVSECVTEIEENRDHSESMDQDLQNAGQQSDALLNHIEESVISSVCSSLEHSVQLGTHNVHKYEETDVQESILKVEEEIPGSVEEIENIPETEKETADSEEDILNPEESSSLNVVSEVAEVLFHKDFQESDHTCDVNKVKEKADEEITEKVERITDIIFQHILNESLKTVCKKDTKYHKSALKILNGNECKSQINEETVTDSDLSNQTFMSADKFVKQNKDKNVDRVDNITNAILEQLLVESSAIFYSKKSKIDSTGNIHEDVGSMYEEETSMRDEVIAGTPTLTPVPPDRSGINVRKRVSEILAESSGCLSSTKEKSRPQDFMITTYDVLSPEEMSQPGSPSKEDLDGTVIGVTENLAAQHKVELEIASGGLEGPENEWFDEDYGLSHTKREAEELRLQQLQIEQEIQELEQAQEQVPYFYIREIPNKPPPPYTPPGQTVRSPAAPCKLDLTTEQEPHFIPFAADELSSLTVTVTSYLYDLQAMSGDVEHAEVPSGFYDDNGMDIKSTSRRIFKKLVFDLTKDIIKETYGLGREKPCAPWDWPAFSHKRNKPLLRSREVLQEVVLKQVLGLFGFAPKAHKEKLVIRWSRKKRDYVDEILMKESHEEESAWTNYDEDEVTVKNEITLGILDSLLVETVQIIVDIRKRKLSKS